MIDRKDLIGRLNALEAEHRPYRSRVDNAPIWPLMRMVLGGRALRTEVRLSTRPTSSTCSAKASLLRSVARIGERTDRTASTLLFLSERVNWADTPLGTADKFAHPLMAAAQDLGLRSILLTKEDPSVPFHIIPGMKVMRTPGHERIREFAHWRTGPTPLTKLINDGALIDGIVRSFGMETIPILTNAVHDHRFRLRSNQRLLNRIRPSIVLHSCWYSSDHMAVNHVCQRLGIPTVDIQHGVQGPLHLAYGPWKAMPEEGCSPIPAFFWCWDQASADNIRSWAPPDHHRPFVGGSPWLEGYPLRPNVDEPVKRDRILVSLQPLNGPLPMDLVKAIRSSSSATKWVFRLHPADREFRFELERWSHDQRIADRIEVEDPTLVPIGSSLMRSLLHVTSYSSVIREAAMLGVHSIAWHPDAAASYPDLVQDGSLTCSLAPLTSGDPSELHMSPPPQRPVHPPLKQRLRSFLDLVGAKYPRHDPA